MTRRWVWLGAIAVVPILVFAAFAFVHHAHRSAGGADGIPVHPNAQPPRTFAHDWVVAENAKKGTTAWRLADGRPSRHIVGYADETSVVPGQPFGLYVAATARWRVLAFRIGWYDATGARQVWVSPWHDTRLQPRHTLSPGPRTVAAPWRRSLLVATTGWPVGSYLLKLQSSRSDENYVPLTVRSTQLAGSTVYMSEDLTWQAYNSWGGYDLYNGPDGPVDRSFVVSFDRPYDPMFTVKFLRYEQPLIARAERLGLPMAYLTDIDVATRPGILDGARSLIVPGHSEYWTWDERRAVVASRGRGMNIAEFGGNAQYWQVRLASTARGGNRAVICYKAGRPVDPFAATDPERVTIRWRDLPQPLPDSKLFGLRYECFPARGSYVVQEPSFFAFRGTGARRGSRYPGLIGEVDRAGAGGGTPSSMEVLTHSPITCKSLRTYSDSSYFVAPSKAGVFAAGTTGWVALLDGPGTTRGATDATVNFVRVVTDNVLFTFAAGPAGIRYPAAPNLAQIGGQGTGGHSSPGSG